MRYHDRLFSEASQLSDNDLKRHAEELDLDSEQFNTCFNRWKYRQDVDEDVAAGNALG